MCTSIFLLLGICKVLKIPWLCSKMSCLQRLGYKLCFMICNCLWQLSLKWIIEAAANLSKHTICPPHFVTWVQQVDQNHHDITLGPHLWLQDLCFMVQMIYRIWKSIPLTFTSSSQTPKIYRREKLPICPKPKQNLDLPHPYRYLPSIWSPYYSPIPTLVQRISNLLPLTRCAENLPNQLSPCCFCPACTW
jgi:hypothetical protein